MVEVDSSRPHCRLCYVTHDGTAQVTTPAAAAMIAYEDCAPVRRFPSWPHKRSYDGWWWSATTGHHIGYESWLERDHVMLFDHDPDVIGIASQPFWIHFEDSDQDQSDHDQLRHAPDYFLRRRDGSGVVVDVRPAQRVEVADERVFERTRQLCRNLGWEYRLCTDVEFMYISNVRWLSGYRHPRFGIDEQMIGTLLQVFAAPLPLADGLALCGSGLRWRPTLFHMLWSQRLRYERQRPLTDDNVITAALEAPATDSTAFPASIGLKLAGS